MKFLCDKCKTRYSIGDDRVRGKILKIRCKNCGSVITVREGMTDDDVAASPGRADPTPGAVSRAADAGRGRGDPSRVTGGSSGGGGTARAAAGGGLPALQGAFAQEMERQPRPAEAAPPQSLEDEWYVSIDGDQSGPFSLSEAQAWITAKRAEDELFCWCEGFDDWLPVEKVSHFRGLRVKATPPPRGGRTAGSVARAAPMPPPPVEDEPKPLFAAALAALEADVAASSEPARRNGSGLGQGQGQAQKKNGPAAAPARPGVPSLAGAGASLRAPSLEPARGAAVSARPAPLAAPAPMAAPAPTSLAKGRGADRLFDRSGDDPEEMDPDALESDDSDEPAVNPSGNNIFAGIDARRNAAAADDDEGDGTDGLDLDIGEVSRVVRLPDLAQMARGPGGMGTMGSAPVARRTQAHAAIARGTGGVAAMVAMAGPSGAAMEGDAALPPLSEAALADAQPLVAQAPLRHRRASASLLVIAGAILMVVAGVVVFVVMSSADADDNIGNGDVSINEGLGYTLDDPTRPWLQPQAGSAATGKTPGGKVPIRRPGTGGTGTNPGTGSVGTGPLGKQETVLGADGQPVLPLTPDDIISVSSRMAIGTRRCYERALKDDPFLKVPKILVNLAVDRNGTVTNVVLSSNNDGTLGRCLTAAIRRWPFRKSTEGINTQFPVVFEQN